MDSSVLRQPVSAEAPCGVDLEDTQLLASFDAFRVFGNDTPLRTDLDWRQIRDQSMEALGQSQDIRLLAHLAAATLRLDGLKSFCELLQVADHWLAERWALVFPRVDDDAVLRKNALSCFSDRMAVIDSLRRAPIASNRQVGTFSLRDLEIAGGQLSPTESDQEPLSSTQIEAILAGSPVEELSSVAAAVGAASAALNSIAKAMQEHADFQSVPDFEQLARPLARIQGVLADHIATRTPVAASAADASGSNSPGGPPSASGAIAVGALASRQDALRAIDAIAEYFRKNEPSSPVPLLLDRAKRLVSKSFLEVLEDIAPESLTQVKQLGGIKGDENQ